MQNELSGLNANDAMYQMALANYNNEYGNFGNAKKSNVPGVSDVVGLATSALPLIMGL